MHKPKPYKCPVCGAEITDLPMPVLEHQLSHVERRPYAGMPAKPKHEVPDTKPSSMPVEPKN